MRKNFIIGFALISAVFFLTLESANAATVVENFESGSLNAWTVSSNGWTVGGETVGARPNLSTIEGDYFARSGAPNVGSGLLAESNTGTMVYSSIRVSYDTLTWSAAGWSGSSYDGVSYFQILDDEFNEIAQIATPQSDEWISMSVNLLDIGFLPGDVFCFAASDNKSNNSYAWMAFDNIQLSGTPVPVPGALWLLGAGIACLANVRIRKKIG